MVNIAFIVGKEFDTYPVKTTSKYAPKWLKEGAKEFGDFVNYFGKGNKENNTVPSDVAMAMYIQYYYPDSYVTLLDGTDVENITQEDLDSQDVIFVIYDAIEIFHCGYEETCPLESKRFERMLNKTSAFVYPHPDFHKYIINKPKYYADLRRAGIPIAPFFSITPNTVIKAPARFKDKILDKGWKGAIIKPSYAGYSLGIKVIKDVSRTKPDTFQKYFEKLREKGFPNATVQEFIPSFSQHYEIRTYWINEKYAFSVGTKNEPDGSGGFTHVTSVDTFVSEGGNIPDYIADKIKPVARKAIRSILQYPSLKHPMVRVDFGCCLKTKQCDESYFINEIETMAANMMPGRTDYPVVEEVAEYAYKFAKKVSNMENIKGKVPDVEKLVKMPCK